MMAAGSTHARRRGMLSSPTSSLGAEEQEVQVLEQQEEEEEEEEDQEIGLAYLWEGEVRGPSETQGGAGNAKKQMGSVEYSGGWRSASTTKLVQGSDGSVREIVHASTHASAVAPGSTATPTSVVDVEALEEVEEEILSAEDDDEEDDEEDYHQQHQQLGKEKIVDGGDAGLGKGKKRLRKKSQQQNRRKKARTVLQDVPDSGNAVRPARARRATEEEEEDEEDDVVVVEDGEEYVEIPGGGEDDGDIDEERLVRRTVVRVLQTCERFSTRLCRQLEELVPAAAAVHTSEINPVAAATAAAAAAAASGAGRAAGGRDVGAGGADGDEDGSDSEQVSHRMITQEDVQGSCPDLTLKPYQLVGVNWLRLLRLAGVNGVLADEMGLGKTIQTLAFLAWYQRNGRSRTKPSLIVVPASTLQNWERELHRFCPELDAVVYHGSQQHRAELRHFLRRVRKRKAHVDVIFTTYSYFERESGLLDRQTLYKFKFNYLILDEAHGIKNPNAARHINLAQIQRRSCVLLTGTPVQNNMGELISLLNFLVPSVFTRNTQQWLETYFSSSSMSQEGNAFFKQLRGLLSPFVLRRLKADVLDQLVSKTSKVLLLEPSPQQAALTARILEEHLNRKKQTKQDTNAQPQTQPQPNAPSLPRPNPARPTEPGHQQDGDESASLLSPISAITTTRSAAAAQSVLQTEDLAVFQSDKAVRNLFTQLRKAAHHPLLLRTHYSDEQVEQIALQAWRSEYYGSTATIDMVRNELRNYSDYDLHQLCMEFPGTRVYEWQLDAPVLYESSKIETLRKLFEQLVAENHRTLVFSQWTRILDILEILLTEMNLSFVRLDGNTPVPTRLCLVDKFNTDTSIPIMLLSTRAGGLGLNLVGADTVIMHDIDFNPEADRQAEDRCHRVGQTRPVTVYKLITKDTVDEQIYQQGTTKQEMASAIYQELRNGKLHDTTTVWGKDGGQPKKNGGNDLADDNGVRDEAPRTLSVAQLLQQTMLQHVMRQATTTDAEPERSSSSAASSSLSSSSSSSASLSSSSSSWSSAFASASASTPSPPLSL